MSTDATVVTVNGEQNYIRNFSVGKTVIYRAMKEKTIDAMGKVRFLEKFTGVLVHDHETALYHFETEHAECNVHIIRYLKKNTEETGNKWSSEMVSLLCEMNKARKGHIGQGEDKFQEEIIRGYEGRYHGLIAEGRKQNKKTAHKFKCYRDAKRRNMGIIENIKMLFMGTPAIF